MAGFVYRVRQFFKSAGARQLSENDLKQVHEYLPRAAFTLFQTMPLGDQRHSLTILRTLLAQGHLERPLLQAALLHDVAKAHIGLAYRTGVILLNAISKNLLPHLANTNPRSWRYPFYLSLRHPDLGAEMAARVGLDPRAVTLIRQHQAQPPHLPKDTTKVRHTQRVAESELVVWQRLLKTVDDQS
jgi:hypothetical protein